MNVSEVLLARWLRSMYTKHIRSAAPPAKQRGHGRILIKDIEFALRRDEEHRSRWVMRLTAPTQPLEIHMCKYICDKSKKGMLRLCTS